MSPADKDTEMTQADEDVMQALQEYREYKQGNRELKTRVIHTPPPSTSINVTRIRQSIGLSQSDFAARYGFRIRTIQEWEQKRRTPEGAARILLLIIEQRPDVVEEVLALSKP